MFAVNFLVRSLTKQKRARAWEDRSTGSADNANWDYLVPEGPPDVVIETELQWTSSDDEADGPEPGKQGSIRQFVNRLQTPVAFLEKSLLNVARPVVVHGIRPVFGTVAEKVVNVGEGLGNVMTNVTRPVVSTVTNGVNERILRPVRSMRSKSIRKFSRKGSKGSELSVAAALAMPLADFQKLTAAPLLSVIEAQQLVKQSVILAELKKSDHRQEIDLNAADELTDKLADKYTKQPTADIEVESEVLQTMKLDVNARVQGTTFINQYVVVAPLGFGTYGKVKLCLNLWDEQLYAVKVISKIRAQRRMFGKVKRAGNDGGEEWQHEVEIMKKLRHQNLVRLFEIIDDPEADKMLLVMEFVEGGALQSNAELTSGCTPLPEAAARKYFRDVVRGLDVLHSNMIIHGDLKPENLLLSADGNVKIADFGSSRLMSTGDYMLRTIGTPAFLAPEVCAGKPYHGRIADIWALGVCLYAFVVGRLPFKADSLGDLYDMIQTGEVTYPEHCTVSAEGRDLISKMLDKEPASRCTLEEAASHTWTTNNGAIPPVTQQEDPQEVVLAMVTIDEDPNDMPQPEDKSVESPNPLPQPQPPISLVLFAQMNKFLGKRRYEPGEWLVRQGDSMEQVFYIRDGQVELIHHSGTPGGEGYADSDLEEEETDSDNSDGGKTVSTMSLGRSQRSQRWTSRVAAVDGGVVTIRRAGEFLGAWSDLHVEEGYGDEESYWDVSIRAQAEGTIVWSLSKQQASEAIKSKPNVKLDLRAAIARAQAEALRSTVLERLSVNRKRLQGFSRILKKRTSSNSRQASPFTTSTKNQRIPSVNSGSLQPVPSLEAIPTPFDLSTRSIPIPSNSSTSTDPASRFRRSSLPPLPPSPSPGSTTWGSVSSSGVRSLPSHQRPPTGSQQPSAAASPSRTEVSPSTMSASADTSGQVSSTAGSTSHWSPSSSGVQAHPLSTVPSISTVDGMPYSSSETSLMSQVSSDVRAGATPRGVHADPSSCLAEDSDGDVFLSFTSNASDSALQPSKNG